MKIKVLFVFCLFFFQFTIVQSQPFGQLTVTRGYSIYFPLTSVSMVQNGLGFADWTEIDLVFTPSVALPNWKLTVEAVFPIIGDGGNTLPPNTIYVWADSPPAVSTGYVALVANPGVDLLFGSGVAQTVHISYYCGLPPAGPMTNAAKDNYFVNLLFSLVAQP